MKVVYIGKNGKYSVLEQDDEPIKLTVMFRYYPKLDSWAIYIDPSYKQINKFYRQLSGDKYVLRTGTLELVGNPNDKQNWKANLDFTDVEFAERYWHGVFKYFFDTKCTGGQTIFNESRMGDMFYLTDYSIVNVRNLTVHLFGKGYIYANTVENCLFYIHGDYEIV